MPRGGSRGVCLVKFRAHSGKPARMVTVRHPQESNNHLETTASHVPVRSPASQKSSGRKFGGMLASLDRAIRDLPAGLRGGLLFALVPLVGNLDYVTGEELSFSVFYLVPIALAARYQRGRAPYFFAIFAGLVWLTVELLSHAPFSSPVIPLWNAAGRTVFFLLLVGFMNVLARRDSVLEAEVRRQTDALHMMISSRKTLEREMAQAVAREHSQIARELHDGVGQYLAGLAFQARSLSDELKRDESPRADRAGQLVEKLTITNRMLRRLDHILSPSISGEGGLAVALGRLVADVRQFSGVECTFTAAEASFVIGEFQALTLFRIAQEAINNSVKHSGTDSVRVGLAIHSSGLRLVVADKGRGFSVSALSKSGEGLRIMHHRAELIGAKLTLRSAPGSGCTVECVLPWRGATSAAPKGV